MYKLPKEVETLTPILSSDNDRCQLGKKSKGTTLTIIK